jgi:hypothetical protein
MNNNLTIQSTIPDERIACKIFLIREEKVILDFHLAEFYGIETRVLKQAVKRNIARFPADFMYELTSGETDDLVSQFVIPSKSYLGGALPFAFTEAGVAMLSSVLKSKRAIEMNIAIMRTFVIMRKMIINYKDMQLWKETIENKLTDQSNQILTIFEYLQEFEKARLESEKLLERPRIGY